MKDTITLCSMCLAKKAYYDKEEAERVVERMKRLNKVFLRVYKCPHCTLYHLTSKREEKK